MGSRSRGVGGAVYISIVGPNLVALLFILSVTVDNSEVKNNGE